MVYNSSLNSIVLLKNQLVGWCQLILQPSNEAYHQELAAMQQERSTEQQKEAYLQHLSNIQPEERAKKRKEDKSLEEEHLSRD